MSDTTTSTQHCDTCTCRTVPDLNAALQAAAILDARGAYSVTVDSWGIRIQGSPPDMDALIASQLATLTETDIRGGSVYRYYDTTVDDIPVCIVSVERAELAVSA